MTTIDLITGILGAGKTTFIRKYATDLLAQGKKIAILENDFGAVNVDRMMLQDLQSDRCKVEMISGCNDPTCHKRRFKTQLIALGMQQFDRVILEPSGIFDMDEFFDTLYEFPPRPLVLHRQHSDHRGCNHGRGVVCTNGIPARLRGGVLWEAGAQQAFSAAGLL